MQESPQYPSATHFSRSCWRRRRERARSCAAPPLPGRRTRGVVVVASGGQVHPCYYCHYYFQAEDAAHLHLQHPVPLPPMIRHRQVWLILQQRHLKRTMTPSPQSGMHHSDPSQLWRRRRFPREKAGRCAGGQEGFLSAGAAVIGRHRPTQHWQAALQLLLLSESPSPSLMRSATVGLLPLR